MRLRRHDCPVYDAPPRPVNGAHGSIRLRYPAHLSLCAALALLATPAAAQLLDDPRAIAMGGVRGDPVANSAVMHNPAGLSRAYLYFAEAMYLRDGQGNNVAGVNIVDSKTQQQLAVGVAYGYQFTDSDADLLTEGHDVRLSMSHPFSDRVHIGVGLHYLHLERSVPTKEGEDPIEVDDLKGFTLDAGLLIDLGQGLSIGLVGENLIDLEDASVPRRAGGGLAFAADQVSIDVDVLADFDRHPDGDTAVLIDGGFELLVADVVPLRAGYTWDGALEQSWVGGGVGFLTRGEGSNGGQISISYRHNLDVDDAWILAAGLTMFL